MCMYTCFLCCLPLYSTLFSSVFILFFETVRCLMVWHCHAVSYLVTRHFQCFSVEGYISWMSFINSSQCTFNHNQKYSTENYSLFISYVTAEGISYDGCKAKVNTNQKAKTQGQETIEKEEEMGSHLPHSPTKDQKLLFHTLLITFFFFSVSFRK